MTERPSTGTATVLFTDLVGSTELMGRLGDTAFDELRAEHFVRLGEAVSTRRGVSVKNTGDGILATFASAVDALSAAVAAQQATQRQACAADVRLALRVGLALGEVAHQGGDVFGTPVVEAARLVAAASPGQILCTALVRAVSGSRAGVGFTDAGALSLKGLSEPLPACEVAWEPLSRSVVALPPSLTHLGRIFVGRQRQLERLTQAWKEAGSGKRRVALLAGEPGIGKTRLAAQLAGGLHAEGALVLAGRCDEDLGVPYQPFVEALRHYLAHAPAPLLGRHGGELTRLVPELADQVPNLPPPLSSDPETERYRLFDAVAAWLANASADQPLLLVLDDLHWAAKPTLLLLRHVLRFAEPLRLLVVVTYRDSEVGRRHPLAELLADLRRIGGVERLSLTGLDREAVGAFIEAAAGRSPATEEDAAFIGAVWEETGGHPFFVAEVIRHLAESGAITVRDGRWVTTASIEDLGIPEGVRDVVGRRLSRLAEGTDRVLGVASVVGLEFEPAVLKEAGGFSEEELFSALEEAAAARLLTQVSGTRFRFAHALVRATLYEDALSGPRRAALHRRVAEAIEALHTDALDDHLPALAYHWGLATVPGDAGRAVAYATRAADRALAQLAHDEAAAYYQQALELLVSEDDPRRLELLISFGDAQRRAGDPGHRETLLEAGRLARYRGDADALARAALANNRGFHSHSGFVDEERVAALESALEAIGPRDSPKRARLLGVLASELGFAPDHQRREHVATEALDMARRLGDMATLGDVLARRWEVMAPTAPLERQVEVDELAHVAGELGDPALAFWAAMRAATNALVLANGDEFKARLAEGAELATTLGQPLYSWIVGFTQVTEACVDGRFAEAEVKATETLELARAVGIPDAFQIQSAGIIWIRYEQGRLEDFAELLAHAAARERHHPLTPVALAFASCALDRLDEARPVFDRLADRDFAALPGNFLWLYGMSMLAEVCARLGDQERAAVLHSQLAPHGGLVASAWAGAAGAADHYLGLLAVTLERYDVADEHFSAAERVHAAIPAPAWLARTRLEWARMLLARGDPGDKERARDLLGESLGAARQLGLATVERRVLALWT